MFRFKGRTEERTLRGVPGCGLRFGAGVLWDGQGVKLLSSSVEETEVLAAVVHTPGTKITIPAEAVRVVPSRE
jgi:hypothetical protein